MAGSEWYRRFTPHRILGRLQREMDAVLQRSEVVFFRCDPFEFGVPPQGEPRSELVEADLERYEQWRRAEPDFPWPSPEEGPHRFSGGHRPFALVLDGRKCCYGWVSVMDSFWINEVKSGCRVDATMTWIWDCVTPVAMRNRGHYIEFLNALRRKFRDRDLLIYCHARNAPSYHAIRRAGFQEWASVTRSPAGIRVRVERPRFGSGLYATERTPASR
jgi:hypothetical protein